MTEEAALRAAIIAEPDEDTPRLAYADWLDENRPDETPSPAQGSSARAEFIRVQCRLASGAFDDPDYPELLEREADLTFWLNEHDPEPEYDLSHLDCRTRFHGGEWGNSRRGFPEIVDFGNYPDTATAEEIVESIVESLEEVFAAYPARTLHLIDAITEEIALLARHPIFEQVRGLYLDGLLDSTEDEAIASIAGSRWAVGLRRLFIDQVFLDDLSCEVLARSPYFRNLESLTIGYPMSAKSVKAFGRSKWFRKLRRLHLWLGIDDGMRALAELPSMPHLQSLTLSGSESTSLATMRQFASSRAFPSLTHLDLSQCQLSAEHIVMLSRGRWPLRHLRLYQNEVRKTGVEALIDATFAPTLRVLELPWCDITVGGVQALANSDALAELHHLNLADNPIGPGGLAALSESKTFRQLRRLDLRRTNTARGPIAARDVLQFLTCLDLPHLRRLGLSKLPVGARGANMLATSPRFTNLTRLHLDACGLGESGTRHLVLSKTLNNLVVLDMSGNKTGSGAGKLVNPEVLPKLGCCYLGTGIPKGTATRLRRRPGIVI
jgi:uncharacterized protein (TIGR02996 family)